MCRKAGLLFLLISIVFCFGAAASAQQQPIPIEFERRAADSGFTVTIPNLSVQKTFRQ